MWALTSENGSSLLQHIFAFVWKREKTHTIQNNYFIELRMFCKFGCSLYLDERFHIILLLVCFLFSNFFISVAQTFFWFSLAGLENRLTIGIYIASNVFVSHTVVGHIVKWQWFYFIKNMRCFECFVFFASIPWFIFHFCSIPQLALHFLYR